MRLGFHYHVPFHKTPQGQIRTPGYLGRFLDSLAAQVDELICFMHSATQADIQYSDYALQAINLRWVDIGLKSSVPRRMIFAHQFTQPIREQRDQLDAMLIRGPSPLLPAVARASGKVPTALLIVGDYLMGIDDLPQPRWRKEAIRAWSTLNALEQHRIAKRSLTFVNSHAIFEQLKPTVPDLVETRTTTLSNEDFFLREDTCQTRPIRLLYTGRMDRAKGLFEMVEALQILRDQGQDVILDLVGWPAQGDTVMEELLQVAEEKGVREYVVYHGFKSVGEDLFAFYKLADIYLIASQRSEGFPRTIWEAMAHSLPVVATRVGSIPQYLEHGRSAWLLKDSSSRAIADGILELIANDDLRKGLIQIGREIARGNTLETRTKELVVNLQNWLSQK